MLLAVDGSELDGVIALAARKLFGTGAEYLAVNVSDPAVPSGRDADYLAVSVSDPATELAPLVPYGMVYPYVWDRPASSDEDAEAQLDEAERVAERVGRSADIEVEPVVELGDPAGAIVTAAAEHEVDVIVVGSRERSWFSRLIDPSVSREVTASSPVPVLVVRAPD